MSQLESLRAAVAHSPDNVPLLMVFAQACLDELELDEAGSAFERVLALVPGHVEAQLGMVQRLQLSGNLSQAIVRTEALLAAKPSEARGWLLLSRLAMAEGQK